MENFLGVAGFFISLISIALTVYYADRFGLRTKIYEKRLSVALDLLETIKTLEFNSFIKYEQYLSVGGFSTIKFKLYFPEEYLLTKDLPIYFAASEYKGIFNRLNQLKSSPYLAVEIAEKLKFLENSSLTLTHTNKIEAGAILTIKYNYEGDLFCPKMFSTLEGYLDAMENVVIEIKKWLKNKSKLSDEFNI
jgi:hypothetical protein